MHVHVGAFGAQRRPWIPGAGVTGGVDAWELDAGSAGRAGSILNH